MTGKQEISSGPERRGPERPGPDYPPEWDSEPAEVQWHCICGEGDDAEFHNILCVGSNTPDEVWYS